MSRITRFRRYIRRGPTEFLTAAGLVVAWAAYGMVSNVAEGVIMPMIQNAFVGDAPRRQLTWAVAGVTFRFAPIVEESIVLILVAVIAYWLALRPQSDDGRSLSRRSCPECQSTIADGARRCPFCRTDLERTA